VHLNKGRRRLVVPGGRPKHAVSFPDTGARRMDTAGWTISIIAIAIVGWIALREFKR
jgi:hypothetical protein